MKKPSGTRRLSETLTWECFKRYSTDDETRSWAPRYSALSREGKRGPCKERKGLSLMALCRHPDFFLNDWEIRTIANMAIETTLVLENINEYLAIRRDD